MGNEKLITLVNGREDFSEVELPITNADLEKIYPLASTKAKEDEVYLEEGREVTAKIQSYTRGYYDLWKKIVEISKDDIKKVYDKLNVHFELWLGESDAVEYFDELNQIFEAAGILIDSDGAKIVEVKEDNDTAPMPPLLFLKSNGTLSYQTTDLATILQRKKCYNPDEIWYTTDGRQALHFEQVFRAVRKSKLLDEDADVVIVFGGVNDYGHGDAELGTFENKDPYTFFGGLRVLIESLQEKYGIKYLHADFKKENGYLNSIKIN